MDIRDQNGTPIDISVIEKPEQDLANQYIMANDVVFELGARYGSVSCAINSKLACKTNQVVVEPDERVWEALERNRETNQCEFHIIRGFVSNERLALTNLEDCLGGYGATFTTRYASSFSKPTTSKNATTIKFEARCIKRGLEKRCAATRTCG